MVSINFVRNYSTYDEVHYFLRLKIYVFQGDILPILGSQGILRNFQEPLNFRVHLKIIPLQFFCVQFVFDHEGDKDSEDTSIEIISKAHSSARNISFFLLLFWEGEANLFLLILSHNNLLRWKCEDSLLLLVSCLSIPI